MRISEITSAGITLKLSNKEAAWLKYVMEHAIKRSCDSPVKPESEIDYAMRCRLWNVLHDAMCDG